MSCYYRYLRKEFVYGFYNDVVFFSPRRRASSQLVATGTLLLVSGFLSFNGGSLGHITRPGDGIVVAKSVINTIMGGSGAAVVIMSMTKAGLTAGKSRWPFAMAINAVLIGMVRTKRARDYLSIRRMRYCSRDDHVEILKIKKTLFSGFFKITRRKGRLDG